MGHSMNKLEGSLLLMIHELQHKLESGETQHSCSWLESESYKTWQSLPKSENALLTILQYHILVLSDFDPLKYIFLLLLSYKI